MLDSLIFTTVVVVGVVPIACVAIFVESWSPQPRFRSTRNRVVLPSLSLMPFASTSRPVRCAAMRLESAADAPDGSCAAISAAREVELTSCFSAVLRWVLRKFLHWPHACGCEYMCLMCEKLGVASLSLSLSSSPCPAVFSWFCVCDTDTDTSTFTSLLLLLLLLPAANPSKQC